MVESKEQLAGRPLPCRVALADWEVNQFQIVTFRVAELDRLDAGRPTVGFRDRDWVRGNLLDVVLLQDLVRGIHVADDDGHMLEPLVIAVRRHRDWPAGRRRDVLRELNHLLTQFQMDDAHVRVEYALHFVVFATDYAKIGHLLEGQDFGKKSRFPVDIRYRKANKFEALYIARQTVARIAGMTR